MSKEYTGQELKESEWLLKIRTYDNMGFLTKLTKKNELPKAFEEWTSSAYYKTACSLPIKVIEETFSSGWKLNEGSKYDMYRLGMSQSWVKVQHPMGFILEIHLENFFREVVPHLNAGKIIGNYKWIGNKLERES